MRDEKCRGQSLRKEVTRLLRKWLVTSFETCSDWLASPIALRALQMLRDLHQPTNTEQHRKRNVTADYK